MTEFNNENRGSIWKNDKKEKDTHPDFTGSLNVAGVDYWVSAWRRKEGASEKAPALTFSVKPKEAKGAAPKADGKASPRKSLSEEMDGDSIPF